MYIWDKQADLRLGRLLKFHRFVELDFRDEENRRGRREFKFQSSTMPLFDYKI